MRVIVVGGGIGGMTAALALHQRGVDVEVFERATALQEVGAGVSLWPNALKALHQLGLKPALDAMSFVSASAAIRTDTGTILSRTSAHEFVRRFGLPATVFHRAELLDALVQAAGAIPIHLGHECRDIAHDADGVTLQCTNGVTVKGGLLVGADGLRSIVRERLGVPGHLRYAGYTAWRGIAPFDTAGLVAGETLGRGQRFGLVPIAGNRVYWYATDNAAEGQREAPADAKRRLAAMFRNWHAPISEVVEATDADAILHNDIHDRAPVAQWGAGRVTLLGDAAHPMTPNLGQGACQAIEDALVLAREIAAAPGAAALRRYEAERMARTAAIVGASRRIGQLGQLDRGLLCGLRNLMLRLTPLSVTYRNLASVVGYEAHLGSAS